MHTDNYEQIFIESRMIDQPEFLKEGLICTIIFHAEEEMPILVEQPQFLSAEVTYTEPGVKGDTATNTMKPATIDTGAEVKVPLFIDTGDNIKVDIQKGMYVERIKS
jgi:elongation factor P